MDSLPFPLKNFDFSKTFLLSLSRIKGGILEISALFLGIFASFLFFKADFLFFSLN